MAIKPTYCCGLECGVSDSTLHIILNGTASFDTTTVRNGARSARTNPTAASGGVQNVGWTQGTRGVSRTSFRVATAPSANGVVLGWQRSNVRLLGLSYNTADSKWYAASDDGTTVTLGATGVTIPANQWVTVDIRADLTANPWLLDIQVDGVALGQVSVALASANVTAFFCGTFALVRTTGTFDLYHDDIMLSATLADYPMGVGAVTRHLPTYDGTHTGTGPNFQKGAAGPSIQVSSTDVWTLLDDVPMAVNTSDWVNQATSAALQYVEVGFTCTTRSAGPRALQVALGGNKATTGLAQYRAKLNDNGVTALIENYFSSAAGSSAIHWNTTQFSSMVGGGVWTTARFDALKFRWGYSTAAAPDVYLQCVMIEAEFSAAAANSTVAAVLNASGALSLAAAAPNLFVNSTFAAVL